MLVTTPKENDYVVLKLSTQEEVFGQLVQDPKIDYNKILIKRPNIVAGLSQQKEIILAPFLIGVSQDEVVEFDKSHVIVFSKMSTEMAKIYVKGTTGIELTGTGIIT